MSETAEQILRHRVFLSLQRAFLGEVFPALRSVSVEWSERDIRFYAYIDGPPQAEDLESLSCVGAEVTADFPDEISVDYEVIRLDSPAPIEDARERVYSRRE